MCSVGKQEMSEFECSGFFSYLLHARAPSRAQISCASAHCGLSIFTASDICHKLEAPLQADADGDFKIRLRLALNASNPEENIWI